MEATQKMKKGYYIFQTSFNDQNELKNSGVYKKIISQCKTLMNFFDIDIDIVNYHAETGVVKSLIRRLPFTATAYRWKYTGQYDDADFIYFRRVIHDKTVIAFLRDIKRSNPNVKIIYEFPTYPYDKEMRGLKNFPFIWKDRYYRRKLHEYVDRSVTFHKHKIIFGVPSIQVMNGIDFDSVKIANYKLNLSTINIIAVAVPSFWHGYDRFLRGLGKYYKSGGKRNIFFHMVGDGVEIPSYKQIIEEYGIKEHVVLHGSKFGAELNAVYDMCCLGVGTLGEHRKGISYSSALKSREYGAKGLPIITSILIDYIPKDYKYQLNIPADDSPVDMMSVFKFYDVIYEKENPKDVAHTIREFAEAHCDMSVTMKPVIYYIIEELEK
jgi:hypothetical protein